MGQDEIYLQVIATSGEGRERRSAAKVLRLLKRGKHWVLVTLLLSNVITNETLPIVLDRSLGGGWPAILASTVLIGMTPRRHCPPLPTDGASHFRRGRSSVHLRPLRPARRSFNGSRCTWTHVDHGPYCMAHSKTARLFAWRGPWNNVQESRTEDSCHTAQDSWYKR